jgi:tripartite-type tricarboxylate transporter receptor subunit TctC
MFSTASSVTPLIKAGRLRALAVTSAEPSPLAPGLPTVASAGLPGYESISIYGVFAPAKTPPAIVARLNQATAEALRDPGVKEKLSSQGLTLVGNTSDEFAAYIRTEIEKWAKVAKAAGLVGN